MTEELYTAYAPNCDMTFIMRDVYDGETPKSTEVVGWYYGEPNDEATECFIGKLKAKYTKEVE